MRLFTPPLKVVAVTSVEGTLPAITAAFTVLLGAAAAGREFGLVASLNDDERMVMASHIRAAGTQEPMLVVENGK